VVADCFLFGLDFLGGEVGSGVFKLYTYLIKVSALHFKYFRLVNCR